MSDYDPIKFEIFRALKTQFGVIHGMRTTCHLDEADIDRAAGTILDLFKAWGFEPQAHGRDTTPTSSGYATGVPWLPPDKMPKA